MRPITYTRKNYELLKTGLNNVVLPTLLNVVNNIEQVVEPESSPQSGVTMLNNIVDNIEQCGQHNIVQSCFQQPVATHNFWPCSICFTQIQKPTTRITAICSPHSNAESKATRERRNNIIHSKKFFLKNMAERYGLPANKTFCKFLRSIIS